MNVVHIHLGPTLPSYFWDGVRQTRRFHSGPIHCVIPEQDCTAPELADLAARGVANTRFDRAPAIVRVREVSWLNTAYGGGGFWQYNLERFFVLAELMREENLPRALYVENDVTIYFDPSAAAATMQTCFGSQCAVMPQGPAEGVTSALFYAGSLEALDTICEEFLRLLPLGEWKLRSVLSTGMVHEAMMLAIMQRGTPGLLHSFPVAPTAPLRMPIVPRMRPKVAAPLLQWIDRTIPRVVRDLPPHGLSNCLGEFDALFDAGPLGQYAGGTSAGHGPGAAFPHHWIGPDLRSGRFSLEWRVDDAGRRYPMVIDHSHGGRAWKLNNLHIHCKRITDFV